MAEYEHDDNSDEEKKNCLEEKEYQDDGGHKEDLRNTTQTKNWWSVVTEVCNNDEALNEVFDGVGDESDLDSLCSDDDKQITKKSKRDYNPC